MFSNLHSKGFTLQRIINPKLLILFLRDQATKPGGRLGRTHQSHRVPDFSITFLVVKLLSEVDQGGEGEDGDGHQDEEEAELLVCLLEGVEEGLETSEMSDQLVNSQDSHHFDQADDLSSFPDDLEVLQALQQEREKERNDSEEVDHVHGAPDEFQFPGGAGESDEVLQGEETDGDHVHHVDDLQQYGQVHLPIVILLQFVNSGDDEREG